MMDNPVILYENKLVDDIITVYLNLSLLFKLDVLQLSLKLLISINAEYLKFLILTAASSIIYSAIIIIFSHYYHYNPVTCGDVGGW